MTSRKDGRRKRRLAERAEKNAAAPRRAPGPPLLRQVGARASRFDVLCALYESLCRRLICYRCPAQWGKTSIKNVAIVPRRFKM